MKEKLIISAKEHNLNVDRFIHITLPELFGKDKFNLDDWFKAQALISEQKFYEKGISILRDLRAIGVDCKMDMQSNKLHCPSVGIYAY